MANVMMCQDDECPSASECHRFLAVPSEQQSYAVFDIPSGAFECASYIPKRDGDRRHLTQTRINQGVVSVVAREN